MKQIYARVGVLPRTTAHPVAEGLAAASDPRVQKVSSALESESCYVIDQSFAGEGVDLNSFTRRNMRAVCEAFPRTGNVVRVFIVGSPYNESKGSHLNGFAYPDVDFAGSPLASACATRPDLPVAHDVAIVAHEVGHLVTNKSVAFGTIADQTSDFPNAGGGHFCRPAQPSDNRYIHFYNLMGGTRFRLYDVWVLERRGADPDLPPGEPQKWFNQYRDLRASPLLVSPTGSGER
jgi:hypothetical protein